MAGVCEVPREEITRQLMAWSAGDASAAAAAFAVLYASLHRIAERALSAERADHTLGAEGLVSEAFLRMLEQRVEWRNREHFLVTAAQMMRRVLIDYARARRTAKRGHGDAALPLTDATRVAGDPLDELLAIHDALAALAALDPMQSEIVEARFFGGLSTDEIAQHIGVSPATIERRWRLARAWLYRELRGEPT